MDGFLSAMGGLRQHSLMPCFNVVGYHITQHRDSVAGWDLRVDARNGDAITVDGIDLAEARAFIKCLERMLIHFAPDRLTEGTLTPDELRAADGYPADPEQPPPADGPPTDPSYSPRTGPPSTGPEPATAQEPFATGGWLPAGTATATIRAGEHVLPSVPAAGACFSGEWIAPAPGTPSQSTTHGQQYELDLPSPTSTAGPTTTHVPPRIVPVAPGQAVLIECTCWPAASGALADNSNCQMHHGVPTIYRVNVG